MALLMSVVHIDNTSLHICKANYIRFIFVRKTDSEGNGQNDGLRNLWFFLTSNVLIFFCIYFHGLWLWQASVQRQTEIKGKVVEFIYIKKERKQVEKKPGIYTLQKKI